MYDQVHRIKPDENYDLKIPYLTLMSYRQRIPFPVSTSHEPIF